MKPTLIYLLIFAFAFLKGDVSLFAAKQTPVGVKSIQHSYKQNNISNSNHKRSLVDLFSSAACCDDDDDDYGPVKKKTGSTVSFLVNDVFEEIFFHCELKRTQHVSECPCHITQPVYIFQKELLI